MNDKEKREGTKPSQRDGKRDETDSLTTNSIAQDAEKVKRVCENLLEYAKACRYALARGERYAALPMREEDAADFEWAAEMIGKLRKRLPEPPFAELVLETGSHALRGAFAGLEGARRAMGLPLTERQREAVVSYLRGHGNDPEEWVSIIQSWFM